MAALLAVGAIVMRHGGKGEPDIVVYYRGTWHVAEVKTGKGTLTPAQVQTGAGRLWPVWRTPEQALQAIGATT